MQEVGSGGPLQPEDCPNGIKRGQDGIRKVQSENTSSEHRFNVAGALIHPRVILLVKIINTVGVRIRRLLAVVRFDVIPKSLKVFEIDVVEKAWELR